MKKNAFIILVVVTLVLGIGIIIYNEINSSNDIVEIDDVVVIQQHPTKKNVWQFAVEGNLLDKDQVKEFTMYYSKDVRLEEWGLTENKVVEKVVTSLEQNIVLKKIVNKNIETEGFFSFYQMIKKLTAKKANKIISLKVVTEKEGLIVSGILIVWIIFILLYYTSLVRGIKTNNYKLFFRIVMLATSVVTIISITVAMLISFSVSMVSIGNITIALISASAATIGSAVAMIGYTYFEKMYKKVLYLVFFAYYVISCLLFYVVSNFEHALIPIIAVPLVSVITWKLVVKKAG